MYGQWEEIDALPGLARGDRSAQHSRFVISDKHGAISLARDASGFQNQLAPAPHNFLAMNIKHLVLSFSSAIVPF